MKKEKIMKKILNWVKDGEGVLHLSEGKYDYVFGKMNVVENLTTIILFGNSYSKSVFAELEKGSAEIVGHYVPSKDIFVDFAFYSPVWEGVKTAYPPNTIFSTEIKKEIGEKYVNLLSKTIDENNKFIPYKEDNSSILEEKLAGIYVHGFKVLPNYMQYSIEEIQSQIAFDEVVSYLLRNREIDEIFAKKREEFSHIETSLMEQKGMQLFYEEKMKEYVPRESDVAYVKISNALYDFMKKKQKRPKTIKITSMIHKNYFDEKIQKTIKEEVIPLNWEIELKDFGWSFYGISNYLVKNATSPILLEKGMKWYVREDLPYSCISEIRYGRNVIYRK